MGIKWKNVPYQPQKDDHVRLMCLRLVFGDKFTSFAMLVRGVTNKDSDIEFCYKG